MKRIRSRILSTLWKHQWAVVGAMASTAFVLSLVGLSRLPGCREWSWPDAIYFSLRLFGFNYDLGGDAPNPYATGNWQLWVASFLAPASTALAVVKTVAQSVAYRIGLWKVSRWREHAIICGAGERGHHLALSLHREGRKVVVVDQKEDLDTLAQLRAEGVLTISGNARDPAILAAASVDTADLIVALTPSVETNLEVVLAASQRKNGKHGKALAYAPRTFATMFEGQKPFKRDGNDTEKQSLECCFFDHNATAARVLVNTYAPFIGPTLFHERRGARILVAGDGDILPELLGVLVTQCHFTGPHLPQITLYSCDLDAIARGFPIHHPQMPLVVALHTQPMPLSRMMSMSLESPGTDGAMRAFDLAFVACREDGDTLTLATNLAQQHRVVRTVVAGLTPSTGIDEKFKRYFANNQPLEGVVLYNLLTLGCEARDVVRQELDRKAQAIHAAYVRQRLDDNATIGDTMALHYWEDLRGDFRQANRSQADHIAIKTPILAVSRSDDIIELLAEAEHRRWMADRITSGWRHAAVRDDTKRLHPSIRPYAELSEADREKDRDAVRTARDSVMSARGQ